MTATTTTTTRPGYVAPAIPSLALPSRRLAMVMTTARRSDRDSAVVASLSQSSQIPRVPLTLGLHPPCCRILPRDVTIPLSRSPNHCHPSRQRRDDDDAVWVALSRSSRRRHCLAHIHPRSCVAHVRFPKRGITIHLSHKHQHPGDHDSQAQKTTPPSARSFASVPSSWVESLPPTITNTCL